MIKIDTQIIDILQKTRTAKTKLTTEINVLEDATDNALRELIGKQIPNVKKTYETIKEIGDFKQKEHELEKELETDIHSTIRALYPKKRTTIADGKYTVRNDGIYEYWNIHKTSPLRDMKFVAEQHFSEHFTPEKDANKINAIKKTYQTMRKWKTVPETVYGVFGKQKDNMKTISTRTDFEILKIDKKEYRILLKNSTRITRILNDSYQTLPHEMSKITLCINALGDADIEITDTSHNNLIMYSDEKMEFIDGDTTPKNNTVTVAHLYMQIQDILDKALEDILEHEEKDVQEKAKIVAKYKKEHAQYLILSKI